MISSYACYNKSRRMPDVRPVLIAVVGSLLAGCSYLKDLTGQPIKLSCNLEHETTKKTISYDLSNPKVESSERRMNEKGLDNFGLTLDKKAQTIEIRAPGESPRRIEIIPALFSGNSAQFELMMWGDKYLVSVDEESGKVKMVHDYSGEYFSLNRVFEGICKSA